MLPQDKAVILTRSLASKIVVCTNELAKVMLVELGNKLNSLRALLPQEETGVDFIAVLYEVHLAKEVLHSIKVAIVVCVVQLPVLTKAKRARRSEGSPL